MELTALYIFDERIEISDMLVYDNKLKYKFEGYGATIEENIVHNDKYSNILLQDIVIVYLNCELDEIKMIDNPKFKESNIGLEIDNSKIDVFAFLRMYYMMYGKDFELWKDSKGKSHKTTDVLEMYGEFYISLDASDDEHEKLIISRLNRHARMSPVELNYAEVFF